MRKPTTGEPYAGEPHVRFGGRGGESLSYPYQSRATRGLVWLPAFADRFRGHDTTLKDLILNDAPN